jgi:hypothetical protein
MSKEFMMRRVLILFIDHLDENEQQVEDDVCNEGGPSSLFLAQVVISIMICLD